jgi:uncharacterized phage protein (TIGR01671 family)
MSSKNGSERRMKEFKFRAWDDIHKQMITEGLNDLEPCLDEYGYFTVGSYLENGDWYELKLTQWTGKLDNNNQRIYEGDIVNYNDYMGVIVWLDTYSQFVIQNVEDYGKGDNCEQETIDEYRDEIEVIGNIYANPELIKEETL